MARRILWSGSVTLPAPTSITVNDEIIWTSDTGRTLAGYGNTGRWTSIFIPYRKYCTEFEFQDK